MRVKQHLAFLGAGLLLSAAPALPVVQAGAAKDPPGKARPGATNAASSSSTKTASKRGGKKTSGKRGKSRRERGQKAPTPDRIREIQSALAREGAYAGEPNGKWDAASVEAMKRFQAARGFNPTGKLDARSLQKLGLGSGVAGLAPPRPLAAPAPGNALRPK